LRALLRTVTLACLLSMLLPSGAARAAAACVPAIHRLSAGERAPDDIVFDGSRFIVGDDGTDNLVAEKGGRLTVLARNLHDPEGIVLTGRASALLVEQDLNRVVRVNLRSGRITPWFQLTNTTGKLGVDSIAAAQQGGILIPDSPNGRLLHLDAHRRIHLIAGGLGRPVGVARYRGALVVPDETAGTVWKIAAGHTTQLGSFSTPDDVVVFRGALLAVTLGDHALWEVRPHRRLLTAAFAQPQGLTLGPDGEVVVADSTLNSIDAVSGLRGCL
jgi:hypothetical protein